MSGYGVLQWWWYASGGGTASPAGVTGSDAGPHLIMPEAPDNYSAEHIMLMQSALEQQDGLLHKRTGDMYHPYSLTVRQRTVFPWVTLTDGDETPSVAEGRNFKTANTTATTVTDFDDGIDGQEITVRVDDSNTTFDFTSSGLVGNAGVDYNASNGDRIHAVYDSSEAVWYCQIVEV